MTGFGKAVAELPGRKITVEIKSLNSKQLDISTRLPGQLREKDPELRARIGSVLERGKVELCIYIASTAADDTHTLNLPLLAAYKAQVQEMAATLGIPEPTDWYSTLLRLPDVLRTDGADTMGESDYEALVAAVDEAVAGLMAHRRAEGIRLEEFFRPRVEHIGKLLAEVETYEGERTERIRARLVDNLAKLPVAEYDRGRFEQEMIYYIEKLDVNEEKQRLRQHLTYFIQTMEQPAPGQGKKLGFIAQEMGREINTLGSKSNHAEMQRLVVMMKDELEQIKEQVLNVM